VERSLALPSSGYVAPKAGQSAWGFFFLGLVATSYSLATTLELARVKPLLFGLGLAGAMTIVVIRFSTHGITRRHLLVATAILGFLAVGLLRGDFASYGSQMRGYAATTLFVIAAAAVLGARTVADTRAFGRASLALIAIHLMAVLPLIDVQYLLAARTGAIQIVATSDPRLATDYQAVSRVFATGAIAMAAVSRLTLRAVLLPLACVFMVLSFFGGGRGETIFGLLVFLAILSRKEFFGAAGLLLVLLFTTSLGALAQRSAVVFRTMELFERGGFARRDVLWAEAASTWLSHPVNWAVGLGANQFQAVTGRDYGWYPHNVVLEAALTGGVAFCFLLAILIGVGMICFVRSRQAADPWSTLFFALLVYYVLVSLKSGSLWSAWAVWLYLVAAPLVWPRRSRAFPQPIIVRHPPVHGSAGV
jgi:hypothetical protein